MYETITLNKSHCAKKSSCSVENDIDWRDINNPPTEVLMIPSTACQSQVFFKLFKYAENGQNYAIERRIKI